MDTGSCADGSVTGRALIGVGDISSKNTGVRRPRLELGPCAGLQKMGSADDSPFTIVAYFLIGDALCYFPLYTVRVTGQEWLRDVFCIRGGEGAGAWMPRWG
jgi:hypothetical protein